MNQTTEPIDTLAPRSYWVSSLPSGVDGRGAPIQHAEPPMNTEIRRRLAVAEGVQVVGKSLEQLLSSQSREPCHPPAELAAEELEDKAQEHEDEAREGQRLLSRTRSGER